MLLSIIIPTKNRQVILNQTCKSLIKIISDNIEILVYDNSNEINYFLSSLNILNFKYIHDCTPKSIGENFSKSIDHASGEYCVFIGDDDAVSLGIESIVKQIDSQIKFDALVYNKSRFFWPGIKSNFFRFEHFASNYRDALFYKNISASDIRLNASKKGFMSIFLMPTPYHNVIRLSLLKDIKRKYGSLVLGISPDISMGFLVSFYAKSAFFVNRSLTLYGGSSLSGAGLSVKKKHHMPISKVDFFKVDRSDWHKNLPFYWSESITFPQSVYMVCEKMNKPFYFNIDYFYSYAFFKEPYLWRKFLPFLKHLNIIKLIFYFLTLLVKNNIWKMTKFYYVKTLDSSTLDEVLNFENDCSANI